MGHKKRSPAASHRKSGTPPTKLNPPTAAEMKQECERALTALRRGNYNKALRLMKEATPKFDNSALFHRVAGTISVKVAAIIDDVTAKQRHLKQAVESAAKARTLSPNSVEYAHFYANLLLEVSTEAKEYEEVVAECERALAVENPNDPALDELETETTVFTEEAKEARVLQTLSELRSVIQRANIASLSTWVKTLGGEDKFRLIPMRQRAVEDPVEVRYLTGTGNGRRSNEIKKASKTNDEKRKEIEVKVTAARLLQQTADFAAEDSNSGGNAAGVTPKVGERRRFGGTRRNSSNSDRKDLVRTFWNSMSSEMKRGLLSINVSDIKAYLDSLSNKDGSQAGKVLSEALAFGETNHTWKFWACCRCGKRFSDGNDHMQHVIDEHLSNLLPKLQSVLPRSVDNEWEEMLISCSWEPLDLTASVRMLEDQSKSEVSEFSGRQTLNEQTDDGWNDSVCVEEMWESSFQQKKTVEDTCDSSFWERRGDDGNLNIERETCDRKVDCKMYNHNNSWPLSDDTECSKLLKKISFLFQVLLKRKCLAVTHLQKVIHYTIDELQGLFPGSQILSCGVDQTPLCICFLGASSLKKIVDFLQNVSYYAGYSKYPEKVSVDDTGASPRILDCEDRITLNESASFILLDQTSFHFDSVKDDVGSGSPINGVVKGGQTDSDLLSWIYTGSPSAEQLATWSRIREERSQEGSHLLETLEKEFLQLQTFCEKKHELLGYGEALQGLEDLCLEECKKREQMADISYCSYESILRNRRDELVEGDNEAVFASNRLELDTISTVLKDAESLHVSQYGYEDSYGGVSSHHYDLEAGEEDWRSKDYHQRLDNCMELTLRTQKEQTNLEISKLDAQIMRKVDNMNQLELKLQPLSVLDYRFILVPLVKSFTRAHLEDLAEKDATEKSDAAREAFLAELDLDSKKNTKSGNDNGKTSQEKVKDRKKNKDLRRNKDSKGGSNDQLETADQFSLGTASDGDLVDSDILESESNDKMRESEDEIRRRLELEAEEQKLEETLEYQRQLENEAKQRRLAEQERHNALSAFEDALDESADVHVGITGELCNQVKLPFKNDTADSVISPQRNLKDDTSSRVADDASVGIDHSHLKTGLPNFGGTSEGAMPFEQQGGKRVKRRNSMKVPEGKYQTVSYVKENAKLENLTTDDKAIKDQAWPPNQSEDGELRILRQLQAEQDEEERFQADLKKAVMQSLEFQERSIPMNLHKRSEDFDNSGTTVDGGKCDNVNEMDLVGPGLQNDVGEYNCFLNVIIQSLWHLGRFKEEFLKRSASEHFHIGNPCVVCALFDILTALSIASGDGNREPVNPSELRIALSNLYPERRYFQEGQMNDASEVLGAIFECLHQSFTSGPEGSDRGSAESNDKGSWDCSSPSCIAHTLFGMNIFEQMNCYNCALESRHMKYTSFFHNINASALRAAQVTSMGNSFDDLMNLVEMNHQLPCDTEEGGCGRLNHIHHILSNPPHVFTAVLGWQNTRESLDDIKTTLEALSTEINIGILYRGLDLQNPHHLVSVVCYYGQHYHCFAYSHDHDKWIMYDDMTVKVIGAWEDVLSMCVRGHLQPQVLFYEAVN